MFKSDAQIAPTEKCQYPELITIQIYTSLNELGNPEVKLNIEKHNGDRFADPRGAGDWQIINSRTFKSTIPQYIENNFPSASCFSKAFDFDYTVNKSMFQGQSNLPQMISNLSKLYYSTGEKDKNLLDFINFLKDDDNKDANILTLKYNDQFVRKLYNIYMGKEKSDETIAKEKETESEDIKDKNTQLANELVKLAEQLTASDQKNYLNSLIEATELSTEGQRVFSDIKKNYDRYLKNIEKLEGSMTGNDGDKIFVKTSYGKSYHLNPTEIEKILSNTSMFGGKTKKNKKLKIKKNKNKTRKN